MSNNIPVRQVFQKGQRWISESEPELGLALIEDINARTVTVAFRATGETRQYALGNAPLKRVRFRTGDVVKNRQGIASTIQHISERQGLLYYQIKGAEICESDLNDSLSFDKPEERLFAGHFDPPAVFDLRVAALGLQYERRKSSIRGFVGGRIDLIPHQLYIASEVAKRLAPRVLLADEVGLGKTIEACLILHALILTGRTKRALVIVPESLVHQWFIELLRRFNLWFHIYDEERCISIESANPQDNPFLEDQLVLCSIRLFTSNERRVEQALNAGWDILVVDEAHHLHWSPEGVSPEYLLVESLARQTPGLLLLTATPEQLGLASHFARLRLLDPDRFYELDAFVKETEQYQEVARQAERIQNREELTALLDRHGTGRVSFRNTRATVRGFAKRIPHMTPLVSDASRHERIDWLVKLLFELNEEKALLICRTVSKVAAIEVALRQRMKNVKVAVFHEGLSLIQRDRNAAWFADERGARILLCSEIGSEGRNFQFSHHLILFDLPLDPEVLEQRIGRLDRIGQREDIHIHIPYISGTGQEVLARWYHEGLNAFERNIEGGNQLLEQFGARLHDLTQNYRTAAFDKLLVETKRFHAELSTRLQSGRDRLLEMNSFRPEAAATLVEEIRRLDRERTLDDFMLSIFDLYAISVEELALRTYKVGSAGVLAESFPGLPADGFTVTTDRQRALVREDLQFLTWDHPLVTGAMDALLGSEKGNSCLAVCKDKDCRDLFVEPIYVLECVAPPELHVDRFLPPTPIRVLVNSSGANVTETATLKNVVAPTDGVLPDLSEETVESLLNASRAMAEQKAGAVVAKAQTVMVAQLDGEIARLEELRRVNRAVRQEEIDLLSEHKRLLTESLSTSRLRLDAVRVILPPV